MITSADKTDDELTRLFNLYRTAELNKRYYGCRAARYERFQTRALVSSAVLSAIALGVLLGTERPSLRVAAGIFAGTSGVVTAAIQYLGWDDKARRFYFLHHAYGHLFAEIEVVLAEIRRAGEITEQQLGSAKTLHDAFGRLEVLDETLPDRELSERLEKEVRVAFPEDYIWTHL